MTSFCMQVWCQLFLSKLKYSHTGRENLSLSVTSCLGLLIIFSFLIEVLQSRGFGVKHHADDAREHQSTNNMQLICSLGRNGYLQDFRDEKKNVIQQLPFSDVFSTPDSGCGSCVSSCSYHSWAVDNRVVRQARSCIFTIYKYPVSACLSGIFECLDGIFAPRSYLEGGKTGSGIAILQQTLESC